MGKKHAEMLLDFLRSMLEEDVEMSVRSYDDTDRMIKDFYSLRKLVGKWALPIKVSASKKTMDITFYHWTQKDEEDAKREGWDFDTIEEKDAEDDFELVEEEP